MQMVGWTTRVKAAVCRWQDPRNIYASDDRGFVSREGGRGGGRKGGDRGGNDFLSLASLCQTRPSGFSRTHSTDFLSSLGGRRSDREGQTFAKWKKAFFHPFKLKWPWQLVPFFPLPHTPPLPRHRFYLFNRICPLAPFHITRLAKRRSLLAVSLRPLLSQTVPPTLALE